MRNDYLKMRLSFFYGSIIAYCADKVQVLSLLITFRSMKKRDSFVEIQNCIKARILQNRLSYVLEFNISKNIFDVFISENRKNPLYDAKIYSDFRSIHPQSFDKAVWLTNQMIEEITGMLSGKNYMMKALFCRFFELMQNKELYRESTYYAKLSNEEQIICRIADAYKNKRGIFSREEIENLTGYNGDYVERIMKRSTGKTLIEFGHDYIIQLAADLLRTTDNSIGTICEELGYSNRHYFNQLFKKKFGVMPSAFRKKD